MFTSKLAKILYTSVFTLAVCTMALAQGTTPAATEKKPIDYSYKPLTFKLNEDGSKYVRFIMWHQFWTTYTQNNAGTKDNKGNDQTANWDMALRRSRFLAYAQISPRFLVLTHWGINNQSFINGGASAGSNLSGAIGGVSSIIDSTGAVTGVAGSALSGSNSAKRPQLYIHDAWTEFAVVPGKLHIGTGLHYWNGVSRMSSNSTLNIFSVDAPIFNWFNIEATDQFARQLGIYAKGQVGRLDYRLALNKPFVFGSSAAAIAANGISVNAINEHWANAGYIDYMFWDKENNTLPYFVGSYLGSKKVLNIGAGWYNHKGATASKATDGTVTSHDETILGADVYMELPINKAKGTMLHASATYYNMDFGPSYLRNLGILNMHTTAASTESWAGGGNAQPTIGTGQIIYAEAGFLLPKLKTGHQIMPYATVTNKNFERIGKASTQFSLGCNFYIAGNNAKITAEYQTRPTYKLDAGNITSTGSKGEFIIQTHIFL